MSKKAYVTATFIIYFIGMSFTNAWVYSKYGCTSQDVEYVKKTSNCENDVLYTSRFYAALWPFFWGSQTSYWLISKTMYTVR